MIYFQPVCFLLLFKRAGLFVPSLEYAFKRLCLQAQSFGITFHFRANEMHDDIHELIKYSL